MHEVAHKVLDRASQLRTQQQRLDAMSADPDSLIVVLWRNRNLICREDPSAPVLLARRDCEPLLALSSNLVFLGLRGERGIFTLALPASVEVSKELPMLAERGHFNDLRLAGGALDAADLDLLSYARGILQWHRNTGHCGRCGATTRVEQGGHQRVCSDCGRHHFPRTDPAVMALVVHEGRCLLARQAKWPAGMLSVLAGFVEPGESLEQAVVREVREEVGLVVENTRYLRSQPWPFPASLMLGFVAEVAGADFSLDDEELKSARWCSVDQLAKPDGFFTPPPPSLAHHLIARFTAGQLDSWS